jgi:aminopeptidase N
MLRSWCFLLLPPLCLACSVDEEEPIVGDAEVSVVHYDYGFDMETRRATATLTLRVEQEGNCFRIPMRTEGLQAATIDGETPERAEYLEGSIDLCGAGWPAGQEIEFTAGTTVPEETWGDSQVGYSVRKDIEGTDFSYLVSWVGGCDRFGPCDARPHTFARYRLTVDHAEGVQVLCPGIITAGDRQTVCDFDYEAGPTYSTFGFAASPSWTKVDLGDWGGIQATIYDLPTANLAGKMDIDEHRDFTIWMVDNFGPFPYGNELRFATAPTYWNGFEHPGNIVLNEQLTTSSLNSWSNPLAHTIGHEIAHQWAGDQTTLADTYDFAWKEGVVEYLVYVHKDELIDASRARKTNIVWKNLFSRAEFYLVPEEKPPLIEYYGDVYGASPMILFRQLEVIFDRATIMQALSQLLGQARAIGVSDVQAALEEATGANLDSYFDAWVYGEGAPAWPQYLITTEASGDDQLVRVEQVNLDEGLFGCAFDIALDGSEPGEELRVPVNLGPDGMASWSTTVTPGFEVTGFRYDPDHQCLGRLVTAEASEEVYIPALEEPWVAPPYRKLAP